MGFDKPKDRYSDDDTFDTFSKWHSDATYKRRVPQIPNSEAVQNNKTNTNMTLLKRKPYEGC